MSAGYLMFIPSKPCPVKTYPSLWNGVSNWHTTMPLLFEIILLQDFFSRPIKGMVGAALVIWEGYPQMITLCVDQLWWQHCYLHVHQFCVWMITFYFSVTDAIPSYHQLLIPYSSLQFQHLNTMVTLTHTVPCLYRYLVQYRQLRLWQGK